RRRRRGTGGTPRRTAVAPGSLPLSGPPPARPCPATRPRCGPLSSLPPLRNHRSSLDSSPEASSRDMSSAPTTPPSVDKVDGFSRKSVRKARQKRSQSSSQFRSQGKPIELTPLPLLKGILQYIQNSSS
uniref:Protein phosphatase 2 regulatory subunit B'epsilon n=1 Tax=Ovis aries TaxID=9940 RepID=A0AC11EJG4_SHEEP